LTYFLRLAGLHFRQASQKSVFLKKGRGGNYSFFVFFLALAIRDSLSVALVRVAAYPLCLSVCLAAYPLCPCAWRLIRFVRSLGGLSALSVLSGGLPALCVSCVWHICVAAAVLAQASLAVAAMDLAALLREAEAAQQVFADCQREREAAAAVGVPAAATVDSSTGAEASTADDRGLEEAAAAEGSTGLDASTADDSRQRHSGRGQQRALEEAVAGASAKSESWRPPLMKTTFVPKQFAKPKQPSGPPPAKLLAARLSELSPPTKVLPAQPPPVRPSATPVPKPSSAPKFSPVPRTTAAKNQAPMLVPMPSASAMVTADDPNSAAWRLAERSDALAVGRSFRDRGPAGPDEGGPTMWANQKWRSKSGRWGNAGGLRKDQWQAWREGRGPKPTPTTDEEREALQAEKAAKKAKSLASIQARHDMLRAQAMAEYTGAPWRGDRHEAS